MMAVAGAGDPELGYYMDLDRPPSSSEVLGRRPHLFQISVHFMFKPS